MSAADLHAEALARIAEQRALIAAGTPGPWDIDEGDIGAGDEWILNRLREADGAADGALMVAAVNDYGPLLDLAESVLLRHAPGQHYHRDSCAYCSRHDTPLSPNDRLWPCPDAKAALKSLGVEHDG